MLQRDPAAFPMSEAGQARSPQPDPKGLLVRQMTSHIPDTAAPTARMFAVCQLPTLAPQQMACTVTMIYSITSSTRVSSVGGTVRPSALAVLRLITSSNLVGC